MSTKATIGDLRIYLQIFLNLSAAIPQLNEFVTYTSQVSNIPYPRWQSTLSTGSWLQKRINQR